MRSLSDAWNRADHWSTRRQILAIVAADLRSYMIKDYFPGVSDGLIKVARRHAYSMGIIFYSHYSCERLINRIGRGAPVDLKRLPMQRFSAAQIEHFIEFILSPFISIDLPFGERNYKLSTGEKIVVPNMIRNMIHSRIIAQYNAYCQATTNGGFVPLKDTILFSILHQCPAAIRKSLSGLDNTSADGSTAFEELDAICDQLISFGRFSRISGKYIKFLTRPLGAPSDEIAQVKKSLHQSRNYLKLGYKMHVSTNSCVPDHCSAFALSDSKNPYWRAKCTHQHDEM